MKVDRKGAEESLKRKGFRKDKSSDHIFFYHKIGEKDTGIKTYVSHSKKYKDIGPDNLESMRKQLKLDHKRQVIDLLECPMSGERYNEILMDKGLLTSEKES
jgi:hypothetical protein